MRAKVALGRGVAVGINIKSVVRTGLHAAFAANAELVVKIDNSIRASKKCVGRADRGAGSGVAVVTSHHAEVAAGVGILTFFDVFHPGAKYADSDLVLLFVRHVAGVSGDTSVLDEYESVSQRG